MPIRCIRCTCGTRVHSDLPTSLYRASRHESRRARSRLTRARPTLCRACDQKRRAVQPRWRAHACPEAPPLAPRGPPVPLTTKRAPAADWGNACVRQLPTRARSRHSTSSGSVPCVVPARGRASQLSEACGTVLSAATAQWRGGSRGGSGRASSRGTGRRAHRWSRVPPKSFDQLERGVLTTRQRRQQATPEVGEAI